MHEINISTKVLRDSFSPFLLIHFNNIVDFSNFPNHLKLANMTPVHKKTHEMLKQTIDQLV